MYDSSSLNRRLFCSFDTGRLATNTHRRWPNNLRNAHRCHCRTHNALSRANKTAEAEIDACTGERYA